MFKITQLFNQWEGTLWAFCSLKILLGLYSMLGTLTIYKFLTTQCHSDCVQRGKQNCAWLEKSKSEEKGPRSWRYRRESCWWCCNWRTSHTYLYPMRKLSQDRIVSLNYVRGEKTDALKIMYHKTLFWSEHMMLMCFTRYNSNIRQDNIGEWKVPFLCGFVFIVLFFL